MDWETLSQQLSGGSSLKLVEIAVRLGAAFLLTAVVAVVYARTYRGFGRAAPMAHVLILVSMATCGIIMGIGDNIALSLGLVGALSIVRFRAAVKDNRDLAYLFWSVAIGLISGAGNVRLALVLLVAMGSVVLVLERYQLLQAAAARSIVILATARGEGDALDPASLLPAGATQRQSVYHRDTGEEESTWLVDFADAAALEQFKTAAQAEPRVSRFQILEPEDTVLG
jgi:hypothetical protein